MILPLESKHNAHVESTTSGIPMEHDINICTRLSLRGTLGNKIGIFLRNRCCELVFDFFLVLTLSFTPFSGIYVIVHPENYYINKGSSSKKP